MFKEGFSGFICLEKWVLSINLLLKRGSINQFAFKKGFCGPISFEKGVLEINLPSKRGFVD